MSERDKLAEVLADHEADVTSYDAGDIHGCRCGWELASGIGWDDKWSAYYAHVADALLASSQHARVIEAAKAEAVESMAHLFRDMSQETLSRRAVIAYLDLRVDSYRAEESA